jgi:signal transduction histidine kinase
MEIHRWMDRSGQSTIIVNKLKDFRPPKVEEILDDTGIRSFVAARLPGKQPETFGSGPNGLLFLGYQQMTAFRPADLTELERALNYAATNIVQLRLRERFRDLIAQQEQQLRGITEIFGHVRERQSGHAILSKIAQTAHEALDVDVVSVLEYDAMTEQFTERGLAGVRQEATKFSPPESFKPLFLDKDEPTIIKDVPHDDRTRESDFVAREGVRDLAVLPMRVNHKPLGLFFANYRHSRDFSDLETLRLFADLAARVIHEARLQSALNADRQRLDRRLIWDQVSAIATASRHEEVTYASAIRNYTATLERFLDRANISEELRDNCICQIAQIERLAVEISEGPIPVPTSLEPELVPLAPTIERIAGRRTWTIAKDRGREIRVTIDLVELQSVHVLGYPSLLNTAIEQLMRNARRQLTTGGAIVVVGRRVGHWAEIRFRDTGPGVPKAVRGKLFKEPIPKEDADPRSRGWGIGCLLVSFAMDQHDGSVEIEETGPYGTTILVRLPISQDQAI